MVNVRRIKFPIFVIICQVVFLVLFGALVEYDDSAKPDNQDKTVDRAEGGMVPRMYPMFQDVHVMIFVGFGFLMTFLKRYGYSAVGINLLIGAFVIQWAIIIRGLLSDHGGKFTISVTDMLTADFAAATVLISFGAVLGKVGPIQLLVMAIIEVVLSQVNEHIGLEMLHVADVGESMFIHAFGAYFGLAVARVLYNDKSEDNPAEGAVYHSDLLSMIGTVFLWLYWPSFNGGGVTGDEQHRAVINTYLSLTVCTLVTFVISALVDGKGKFDMVHIQNATLAGGVAVGTAAHMPLHPWGAMLLGAVAAVISTVGYKYITPCLSSKIKLHDTCGVHNLHGLPGILAAVAGAVMAALSSKEKWGTSLFEIFPEMAASNATGSVMPGSDRSATVQGGYQMLALVITLAIAIVGGIITGFILKLPIWDSPEGEKFFDDNHNWNVAEEGFPGFPKSKYENGKSNDDTEINLMSDETKLS
ncbi:ammonium transporter Rh type A-like [Mytilus trossulus]|uniref:ammonium transporter Rh type A-like n=1 Tax=Mytilus trossulus TaxID=6551 RepID=UPI003003C8EE